KVGGSGVRTLADLGLKTLKTGNLTLDTTRLASAMAKDPVAVDAIFTTAKSGIAALAKGVVKTANDSISGTLVSESKSLSKRINDLDDQADNMQRRVDSFQAQLVARFAAMEKVVSSLRATGNFLTQQENLRINNK